MDLASAFTTINWLSVLVAAISAFLVGGLWYGPLLGKSWMVANGFTEADLQQRNPARTFGLSFLLALVAALVLEMFIGPEADLAFGTIAGFMAGLGWVATLLGIIYLFEMKSLRAFLINGGYCVVALTVMGLILGAW